MNHHVRPEANSNSKPDFGLVNFTWLRVRQFIGDMELLMYQQHNSNELLNLKINMNSVSVNMTHKQQHMWHI